jgi:hypothetical protein
MEPGIRDKIAALAARFAEDVVGVISESIAGHLRNAGSARNRVELRGVTERAAAGGSRIRRSASQLDAISDRIVAQLGKKPDGVRAEDLRASLGLPRSAIARPIAQLLSAKRIRKTGEKRRTTYFLTGGGGGASAGGGRGKRGKKPKAEAQGAAQAAG